jgi:hypothetical protein
MRGTPANVSGAQVASTYNAGNGHYYTELKLPRVLPGGTSWIWYAAGVPVVDGLTLTADQLIGLNMTVTNYEDSDQGEFSGTWTSLFAPHCFVDFTLQSAGGPTPKVLMTFLAATTIPDGVGSVANEDIVQYDPATDTWSLYFDGSDVGLTNFAIDGLAVLPTGELLISVDLDGNLTAHGAPAAPCRRFRHRQVHAHLLGSTTACT